MHHTPLITPHSPLEGQIPTENTYTSSYLMLKKMQMHFRRAQMHFTRGSTNQELPQSVWIKAKVKNAG